MSDIALERNYKVPDVTVQTVGNNFYNQFKENYFSQFNSLMKSLFNEEFLGEFATVLQQAEEIPSDDVLIDNQAEATEEANLVREICIDEVGFGKLFISHTFDGKRTTLNSFGFNDLENARYSNEKMWHFMIDYNHEVEKHREKLIENDYPESRMARAEELMHLLKKELDEQLDAKKYRHLMVEKRVTTLNSIWHYMTTISKVRKHALPDSPAAQAAFELPKPNTAPIDSGSEG